ncbi:MAG TPA: cytochrome c biogenesis protein CcsA [Prolixibacteraceae bacterium]|nr:cytochrome c biogenesis protein CcsA [Prolixibacteraceae bacterium]
MKNWLFGFRTTIILLIIIAVAIISATFIESSAGTDNAWEIVYGAKWFEFLLFLLTINIAGSIFLYKSFSLEKISVPLFHLAFILILIGAFFTRYTGKEGIVYIREGEKTNTVVTNDNRPIVLPFNIYLEKFELQRYPGSQSPSGYSSFVKVEDPQKGKNFSFHIYMNHILKYRGWRFFQTSYDTDEKGTILSATHDTIGTTLTYSGYALTVLLLLVSLFMPGTYFRKQLSKLKTVAVITLLMVIPSISFGFSIDQKAVVDKKLSAEFGKLVIQDPRGRMKTMNTYDNEFMRKIYGKESLQGYTADQVVLSMAVFPEYWQNVQMIKISNKEINNLLKINRKYISYNELFSIHGEYLLGDAINSIFKKPMNSRNKTDKALIQLDEKTNIFHSVLENDELNIFPVKGAENHKWFSPNEAYKYATSQEDSVFLKNIFTLYLSELARTEVSGEQFQVYKYCNAIKNYQKNIGAEVILPPQKIKAEIIYNQFDIFKWAEIIAIISGFTLLVFFFLSILKNKNLNKKQFVAFQTVALILLAGILTGIGLRWYIGGYIPINNSYGVMIFLSAVVLFAGLLVSRKQPVVLALSLILAFTFLLVAGMNNANPEIGNLVPVLKSYWLSIHVAVITSSYALFAMVMMMALVNMTLYLVAPPANYSQIVEKTKQLGAMIQVFLIIGLYLMTTGTILGAVWANESWGHYWSWDSKESWALISILVYAFVAHIRLIPSLQNEFWKNMAAFWAFSSILMTFFGVNYFLTGMHSYAGEGDATIPAWLYVVVILLIVFTILSGNRFHKLSIPDEQPKSISPEQ